MGWKMTTDRETFDKEVAKQGFMPLPVTLCGSVPSDPNPFQASTVPKDHAGLTRHHVIPHHLLIAVWNMAVDRGHLEVLQAMTVWGQLNPVSDLPGVLDLLDASPTPDPQKALMRVAWNPWNIVIGPKMEHRVGDPSDAFDRLQFRELGAFDAKADPIEKNAAWLENLARQEFNTHVDRLYRIYLYMERYIDTEDRMTGVDVNSLVTLLRSDKPSNYGRLNDGAKSQIKFGGAILSPALWTNFSYKSIALHGIPTKPGEIKAQQSDLKKLDENEKMPEHVKSKQKSALAGKHFSMLSKESKIIANGEKWGVINWSSVSYLPEPPLPEPTEQGADLWEPGSATLPLERYLLSRVAITTETVDAIRLAVTKAARSSGKFKAHAKIVGPRGSAGAMPPRHDDVVKGTIAALTSLKRDGYDFRIARTFADAPALEVRFYSQ